MHADSQIGMRTRREYPKLSANSETGIEIRNKYGVQATSRLTGVCPQGESLGLSKGVQYNSQEDDRKIVCFVLYHHQIRFFESWTNVYTTKERREKVRH